MSRHSATGSAWQAQRLRVLARDGWVCTYCGVDLVGGDATVDHIEPIGLNPGRAYQDHDLVAACRRCNGRKQDRPYLRVDYIAPGWA